MNNTEYGFIFIEQSRIDELNYQEGQIVCLQTEIPAILINYEIATIDIIEWPGKLWFVENLDSYALASVQQNSIHFLSRHFKLVKQLTSSLLFGARGENISLLLDKIRLLNMDDVHHLANLFTPMLAEIYAASWNNWLASTHHLPELRDADYTGTLAISSGENISPINSGFLVIKDLIIKKAKELEGDNAFVVGSDEWSITLLNPLWNRACGVLLQAAMALGAEEFVPPKAANSLLAGWYYLTKS